MSNRQLRAGRAVIDYDIWFVTRLKAGWSEPQNMGASINSIKDEFYPSLAKNGSIYFTREVEGAKDDIVVCRFTNGNYQEAVSLTDAVNTKGYEFSAFVNTDEIFFLFLPKSR